jgi:RNA polymerase sigma factor (sigma-70 family)
MQVESNPSAADEDAALMRRVQAADETAFAALMERWERPVKALIARIVLNASDAEDLAQETFARIWLHRDRFTLGRPVKPWILGIAVNLARNRLRWWRKRPVVALEEWVEFAEEPAADTTAGAARLERAERARAVRDAIARLPAKLRESLVLAEYEHMSHGEIGQTVGATAKAVENRLARARERLRAELSELRSS